MKQIEQLYIDGHATNDDYAKALRAYQTYVSEIKRDQRETKVLHLMIIQVYLRTELSYNQKPEVVYIYQHGTAQQVEDREMVCNPVSTTIRNLGRVPSLTIYIHPKTINYFSLLLILL